MNDWSQILLIALGGGALTVVGLVVGIRYAVRRFLAKLLNFVQVPPARITTERLEDVSEHPDPREWAPWVNELQEANYRRVSTFTIPEVPGLVCSGWLEGPGRTAVLYDHPHLGQWWDLVILNTDRTTITVTSNPNLGDLPAPPFSFRTVLSDMGIAPGLEVLEREFQMREHDFLELPTLTEETFLQRFKQDYADQSDWRNAHQRPTKDQVRERLLNQKKPVDDEAVTEYWTRECEQMNLTLEVGLRERFEAQQRSNNSPAYRSGELVCVHDALTSELLLENLKPFIDEEDQGSYEPIGLPPEIEKAPLSQSLELLNPRLPAGASFERVGSVDFPLLAYFYLAPRSQIPIDLFPHKPISPED